MSRQPTPRLGKNVVPLRWDAAEIADWKSKSDRLWDDVQAGRLVGAVSMFVYSDGRIEIMHRGKMLKDAAMRELIARLAEDTLK